VARGKADGYLGGTEYRQDEGEKRREEKPFLKSE